MTAIEALRAFLAASSTVTALVSAANLSPAEGSQESTEPRIVYERESEVDDYNLDGSAGHQPTLRGKLSCYGGKWGDGAIAGQGGYTTARQIADAVKAADGGLSPSVKLESWVWNGNKWVGSSGVIVQAFWFEGDADRRSDPVDASGRGEQWVELSFVMCYFKQ